MKVTGFTIAKNAVKFGYPIKESILSILPICDEFIVAIGESEDNTLEYIRSIDSPKIKIIKTVWNETLNDGGRVLAVETDKAFKQISADTDWCFYIQADEVVHEKYLDYIKQRMEEELANKDVEGLLFKYHHFYHSFDYIGASSRFYKREIRIVKNIDTIYSYRDAQGFRIDDNRKIKVKLIDAYIYHYGWVRPPEKMYKKNESMIRYYYDKAYIKKVLEGSNTYDYALKDAYLIPFEETHPKLMQSHADAMNWSFDINEYRKRYSLKDKLKSIIKKFTPINPDFANYNLIK